METKQSFLIARSKVALVFVSRHLSTSLLPKQRLSGHIPENPPTPTFPPPESDGTPAPNSLSLVVHLAVAGGRCPRRRCGLGGNAVPGPGDWPGGTSTRAPSFLPPPETSVIASPVSYLETDKCRSVPYMVEKKIKKTREPSSIIWSSNDELGNVMILD